MPLILLVLVRMIAKAPLAPPTRITAMLSTRGMSVALASIVTALVASVSLPPSLAAGAPDSEGVERRDISVEASADSCVQFEMVGEYRLDLETDLVGDCSIDCVLSAPGGPYRSWATVCLGLYASSMDAQEAWDESAPLEGTHRELYRSAIIDVWTSDPSDGGEAPIDAFITVAKGVVDSLAVSEADEDDGEDSGPAGLVPFADDFDGENGGTGMLDYGAFAHWTVDDGAVDLLGDGLFDFHQDAGLYLDLDGSRNAGGTLVSKEAFALTPGRYRLEFDLAGHPFSGPETVTVTLGEVFAEDFTMPHDPDLAGFEHMVRDIGVDTATEARLSFAQHGGDNVGVLLDGVRLSRLPEDEAVEVDETAPPATAAPVPTPAPTPAPTSTAAPVEPTPLPAPPAQEAAWDLWFHEGDIVTRVDYLSGEVIERWDVAHPDCPSGHGARPLVQSDGAAAWLPIVDAEWETPVLECLIRLPLDGASELEVYPVSSGRKPTFIHDAATQGEELWAITWKKQDPGGTLEYYDDWSLARLDRWTGGLTTVLPRVVAMAATEAGLVVLYSGRGAKQGARRPLRLGLVEPGRKTPRQIELDVALGRTKAGTYVTPRLRLSAGHAGTVALYDDGAGRDVIVFDPASGALVGRVPPPDGATAIGRVMPVSDGVWMSGLLEGGKDFVRYVPFDGWASLELDPCTDVAADCYAQVETASDAGAWVSAWPYDAAFELKLDDVVMRRYDASGLALAEITGEELFGSG